MTVDLERVFEDNTMTEEYRNFTGEIKNLQKKNDFIYEVEVWLLNDKVNRNNWLFSNLAANKNQFAGTPLLVAYVNEGTKVGDGHNFEVVRDAQGNEIASFTDATAERIIGMLSEDTNDIRIEMTDDGTQWIVAKGFIWKWYAQEAVEKIERDGHMGRNMSISIEALVTQNHMNEVGVEVEDEYTILGTTLLGDGVAPAVAGAHIKALQELASEFEEVKLRAASYMGNKAEDEAEEEEEKEEPEAEDEAEEEPEQELKENKTQKSTKKGESKTVKAFSKKQIAELSPKFDGYTVLSAGQDENGIHVALMAADGCTAVYNMETVDDMVDTGKIHKCAAQTMFSGEGWELAVDSCELTDTLSAAVITANAQLETANADLETAKSTIESMTAKEMKRRVSAAKAKALSTLEAFNANRENKIDSKILTKINEAIENGEYSECENAEGEWCGEEKVCEKVLAACASEVMEMDKQYAMSRNSEFVWDSVNKRTPSGNNDVQSLLSKFGIK